MYLKAKVKIEEKPLQNRLPLHAVQKSVARSLHYLLSQLIACLSVRAQYTVQLSFTLHLWNN
jgi:hypothetical protein